MKKSKFNTENWQWYHWLIAILTGWYLYSKFIAPFFETFRNPFNAVLGATAPSGYSYADAEADMNRILLLLNIDDAFEGYPDWLVDEDEEGALKVLQENTGAQNRFLRQLWRSKRNGKDPVTEMQEKMNAQSQINEVAAQFNKA